MKVENFLTNFGYVAAAPEGISRLREMIYYLAVTGALTEQREEDGTAESLLIEIGIKKQRMIAAGLYKQSAKLENLRDAYNENLPRIPSTWVWTRLVEVGEISPKNECDDDTLVSFVPMSAISEMHSSQIAAEQRPWASIKKGYTHFADGDVVLAKITPCFENGKAAIISGMTNRMGAGTTELHVVRPVGGTVLPGFIYVFLRSPYFKTVGENYMTGTAGQKRLPTEYFAARPMPFPPLAEQKRIVSKVDELMALCDELEAQQQESKWSFSILSKACNNSLTDSPSPSKLNRIFEEIGSVSPDDLRKTIRILALQGRLTHQDTAEADIESSLKRNDTVRYETASNDRRADTQNQPLLSEDDRWAIPDNWAWRGLADLVLIVDYRGKTPRKTSSGVRLLTAKNVRKGEISLSPEEFISDADYSTWMTRGLPKVGDVLFTTEAPMGNAAVVDLSEPFALAQRVICFKSYGAIDPAFLVLQILSDPFRLILDKNGTGVTAKGIKASKLKRLPITVPPIAEQRRIVVKVNELNALVNELEKEQEERDELAEAFAKACVGSFTGTGFQSTQKMKAPKTELTSNLVLQKEPLAGDKAPLATILHERDRRASAKQVWKDSQLEIGEFYQQLKSEIASGWIAPPEEAVMSEVRPS